MSVTAAKNHGTSIEWTHRPGTKGETWNPIRGRNLESGGVGHFCVHVDGGCKNCYAETFQPRFKNPIRFAAQDADKVEVFLDEKTLTQPMRWKAPRTIFVCSMSDLFGDWVSDDWLDRIFAVMALCPQHTFIVPTKRPPRMGLFIRSLDNGAGLPGRDFWSICASLSNRDPLECWPLPNVWCGTSVSDQPSADERIPHLLATPAAIRFVSYEPALGPADFSRWLDKLDQIIAGGESGNKARPAHPDWFRACRDQCAAAGVPFFFKQWGEFVPGEGKDGPEAGKRGRHIAFQDGDWMSSISDMTDFIVHAWASHQGPPKQIWQEHWVAEGMPLKKVGKKAAGALLDGKHHREYPKVAS